MSNHTDRPKIALVAGEASGDLLGADLIQGLRKHFPGAQFAGVGGAQMQAAGIDSWYNSDELAVMGLVEVLRHLPRLLRLRKALLHRLLAWQPDVFIGIDAPDFNLGLERSLKDRGIRTAHYVSPSVWAWREGRAAKIGRSADRVLCLFPIEPPIYAKHHIDARFVGHPLARQFDALPHQHGAREQLGLLQDQIVLAILPGSRRSEIERLGKIFLDAGKLLAASNTTLTIVIPAANDLCLQALRFLSSMPEYSGLDIRLLQGQSHLAMIAANAVMLASGTAALEAALAKRPMVVGYKIAPLTHFIVKQLGMLKINRYSLPNILAGAALVPELMQEQCTAENIATALQPLLTAQHRQAALIEQFNIIHNNLREPVPDAAAHAVAEMLSP